MQFYRLTMAYRSGARIILRSAVVARRNLGLAAHWNDKTEVLNRNVVHKLIPNRS